MAVDNNNSVLGHSEKPLGHLVLCPFLIIIVVAPPSLQIENLVSLASWKMDIPPES